MKVTRKLQREIAMAIHAATSAVLDRYYPDTFNYPPDTWDDEQKRLFDVVMEVGGEVEKRVGGVISGTASAQ